MSAATVTELGQMPQPTETTVAYAFVNVAALCDSALVYQVDWFEDPNTGHILNRFSRNLAAEAWLVATPLNGDGTRNRLAQRVVFTLTVPGEPRVTDYAPLEQRLREELEEAKRDYRNLDGRIWESHWPLAVGDT